MLYGIFSVGQICFEAWKVLGLEVGGWGFGGKPLD